MSVCRADQAKLALESAISQQLQPSHARMSKLYVDLLYTVSTALCHCVLCDITDMLLNSKRCYSANNTETLSKFVAKKGRELAGLCLRNRRCEN